MQSPILGVCMQKPKQEEFIVGYIMVNFTVS